MVAWGRKIPMLRTLLDGIEALAALAQFGTVSEAATRLRLTQSAVSKRIRALQDEIGSPLVRPEGRRLTITAEGIQLLERARPPLAELRHLASQKGQPSMSAYTLALSDSIAQSWGPKIVARALASLSDLRVDLHAHRTVLLLESVRLGRYHIGFSTEARVPSDLVRFPIVTEPMVLIGAGLKSAQARGAPLITIEAESATWRVVEPQIAEREPKLLSAKIVGVESFGAALQMVKAGFGNGLLPVGLVRELGIARESYRVLRHVGRPISLFTRKTVPQLESFTRLHDALARETQAYFEEDRSGMEVR